MTPPNDHIVISPSVARGMEQGKAIVALESTIITHGMPFPRNLETALSVEQEIQSRNAIAATIAVLDGKIHVGLDRQQLNALARSQEVMKLSRADIAYAVSQRQTGSTTVAATMMVAKMVAISVFATGGIGGVHRGAEENFDISADLKEFSRSNVIVVCAGPKAILDLNKTLEVLETNGVPVIGYKCDELPAFWSRNSGIPVPLRMDSAKQIAQHAHVRHRLGINGGMLIANPVPAEHEIPASVISSAIDQALNDAKLEGVSGKAVTPYLLAQMVNRTQGKSLETNIELMLNNACLAADIAVALNELAHQ